MSSGMGIVGSRSDEECGNGRRRQTRRGVGWITTTKRDLGENWVETGNRRRGRAKRRRRRWRTRTRTRKMRHIE
eukprot:4582148-Pyramimonas_sp.AAC.1